MNQAQRPLAITGTLADLTNALTASVARLQETAENALDLLALSGHAGSQGDTADDLKIAVTMHLHLMQEFSVLARTALDAYDNGFNEVSPVQHALPPEEPELTVLAAVHRMLQVPTPLHIALACPKLRTVLAAVARKTKLRPIAATGAYQAAV